MSPVTVPLFDEFNIKATLLMRLGVGPLSPEL